MGDEGCAQFGYIQARGGAVNFMFTLTNSPIFTTTATLTDRAFVAACGPLAPVRAQWACSPHHGQCGMGSICWNLSQGGSYTILSTLAKDKGNYHKNTRQSDGLLTPPVALWCPFHHNEPDCYIMGNAGCTQCVEIWARWCVLRHFSSVAIARWRQPVTSVLALDPLYWAMRVVSYRRTTTAIKMASKYGALFVNFSCMRPRCPEMGKS